MRQKIVDLIIEIADELGEDEIGIEGGLKEDSVLFGKDGALDSMGLVTLIVAVEQAIEDRFDVSSGLADEKAMSQANSPYRSVATLADYAAAQIEES
jgi:acyl carrier protein